MAAFAPISMKLNAWRDYLDVRKLSVWYWQLQSLSLDSSSQNLISPMI